MKHLANHIANQPFINLAALERAAGLTKNTLSNFFGKYNRQTVSDANWIAVLKVLCPVIINAYTFTYDPDDGTFIVSWEDTERKRKIREYSPGTFTYWLPCQRDLIDFSEYHELKWYLDEIATPDK